MPNEDSLRYKYTPLPDEPRFKKKRKKVHMRSDHKHVYENVAINVTGYKRPHIYIGKRCKLCGRLADYHSEPRLFEPPESMPLYEVDDFPVLWEMKELPERMRVK